VVVRVMQTVLATTCWIFPMLGPLPPWWPGPGTTPTRFHTPPSPRGKSGLVKIVRNSLLSRYI
jgi:hypothetical protein